MYVVFQREEKILGKWERFGNRGAKGLNDKTERRNSSNDQSLATHASWQPQCKRTTQRITVDVTHRRSWQLRIINPTDI